MLNNDTLLLSDVKTSSFAGRLPNEPGIVKRTILDAYISNFTGCVGARFGRLLIYNRHLTVEEQQYNFEVDK